MRRQSAGACFCLWSQVSAADGAKQLELGRVPAPEPTFPTVPWAHGGSEQVAPCSPCLCPSRPRRPPASVQKQPAFCVLHHPLQPFVQPQARHGAARHDGPLVRLDGVQPESLHRVIGLATAPRRVRHAPQNTGPRTCRTSSSLMDPATSLLFLNTSRLAPMSRCVCVSNRLPSQPRRTRPTSSKSNPSSSCRQSSMRSRSVASTTQISVSVFSK